MSEIAPVTVTANYQSKIADVVMSSVVIPLEEQINGVEDMTYMTSLQIMMDRFD
jgi:HAE1 family hydrophobic/amphiphilic exporter-1